MANETNYMTTYFAKQLIHTPNDTSVFLRGDNTFTNTLLGPLNVNVNSVFNLNNYGMKLGSPMGYNLVFDGRMIQALNGNNLSSIFLNPFGGSVQISSDGLFSEGNISVGNNYAQNQISLFSAAGRLTLYAPNDNQGDKSLIVTNANETDATIIQVNQSNVATFIGNLTGNATTAGAWASARNVYVDLTSTAVTSLNAGTTNLGIGVSGTLPIGNGGTNATNANDAVKNLATGLTLTNDSITDDTVLVASKNDGTQNNWYRYTMDNLWSFIQQKTDERYSNIIGESVLVVQADLNSSLQSDTPLVKRNVPTSGYKVGWLYKVIYPGIYANVVCDIGDMVLCVNDGPSTGSTIIPADWSVIQGNIINPVSGPDTNVDGNIVLFDGANSQTIKDGGTPENFVKTALNVTMNGTRFLKEDGTWASININAVIVRSTVEWQARSQEVQAENTILVYSDYSTITKNNETINIPGIKIADGVTPGWELPFVDEDLRAQLVAHINNTDIHITSDERTFWNNKLNYALAGEVLQLNRL